jgi:hypothetical protein
MADSDFLYFPGANGVATDDIAPTIGAIADGGAEIVETAVNTAIFSAIALPVSGIIPYFGGAYRKLGPSAGTANNPRFYNRAGAIPNVLAGIPRIVSSWAGDVGTSGAAAGVGLQVRCMGMVGGIWTPQWVNLNGTNFSSDVNGGAQPVDALGALRWELALNGAPTFLPGDVGCFIGTQLCCVLRGTLNPRRGISGQGNNFGSAEVKIGVAAAKNTTIEGTNRLTAPHNSDLSPLVFSNAVLFGSTSAWAGSDQSITVPGGAMVVGDYIGYGVEFDARPIPAPLDKFVVDVGLLSSS